MLIFVSFLNFYFSVFSVQCFIFEFFAFSFQFSF